MYVWSKIYEAWRVNDERMRKISGWWDGQKDWVTERDNPASLSFFLFVTALGGVVDLSARARTKDREWRQFLMNACSHDVKERCDVIEHPVRVLGLGREMARGREPGHLIVSEDISCIVWSEEPLLRYCVYRVLLRNWRTFTVCVCVISTYQRPDL